MSWLYVETWFWYLIAFLVGLLLVWLFMVRPQQRRLKALLLRTPAPGGTAADDTADDTGEMPRAAAPVSATATARLPTPTPDAPTESIPAEQTVDHVEDAPTDVFPAVDPALSTLDTATLAAAEPETPHTIPERTADGRTIEQPIDTPHAQAPVPGEPIHDGPADRTAAGQAPTAAAEDAPTTARLRRDEPSTDPTRGPDRPQ